MMSFQCHSHAQLSSYIFCKCVINVAITTGLAPCPRLYALTEFGKDLMRLIELSRYSKKNVHIGTST